MDFKNTSEYAYLSALNSLFDACLNLLNDEGFTEKGLETIAPELDKANKILNADIRTLNIGSDFR